MRLRQLEYFVAVSEAASFTRAAERLFVAQPSLSQQIKALEGSLKVTLFDRTPSGIRLTPAGRALLPEAKRILENVARAKQSVAAVRRGEAGDVHVLAVRSLATGVLPPAVSRWHASFPKIVLRLDDFPHQEAMETAFREGVGDLAVGPRLPGLSSCSAQVLGFEELVLVASETSPLLTAERVGLPDLANEEWVLFDRTHGLTRVIQGLCTDYGFEPKVVVWTGSVATALEVAVDDVAVTVIPNNSVPGDFRSNTRSFTPPIYREIRAYRRNDDDDVAGRYQEILSTTALPLVSRDQLPDPAILV